MSNLFVEEEADGAARLEAYVLASHYERTPDGQSDRLMTFAGRYIDRVTQQGGVWRIAHRHLRHDWSTVESVDSAHRPTWIQSGRGGTPDPLDR